jgi:hypothetical protein
MYGKGGWGPGAQREESKSEQVEQGMDLEHFVH